MAVVFASEVETDALTEFVRRVLRHGSEQYRDFAWRRTTDPYAVLVSEVMLQQTQTVRVQRYFDAWLARFPTADALAAASIGDVLEAWQGLGYNRRALLLKQTGERISEQYGGEVPATYEDLLALPGVGAATAAGVLVFAYNRSAVYLETNVRTVVLHEWFGNRDQIGDGEIREVLVHAARVCGDQKIPPRVWNYALLDWGAYLKRTIPNPSRRSKHHSVQSRFEGSRRQKRATLLRAVLTADGGSAVDYAQTSGYDLDIVEDIFSDLVSEGFLSVTQGRYRVASP